MCFLHLANEMAKQIKEKIEIPINAFLFHHMEKHWDILFHNLSDAFAYNGLNLQLSWKTL